MPIRLVVAPLPGNETRVYDAYVRNVKGGTKTEDVAAYERAQREAGNVMEAEDIVAERKAKRKERDRLAKLRASISEPLPEDNELSRLDEYYTECRATS